MEVNCVYRNPNAPIEERIKDLLSRMTLQEKLAQMTQIERSVASSFAIKDLGIGSILSAGGSAPFDKALSSDWADIIDGFQKLAMDSRLAIPIIYGVDAVHGNNNVYGATIFPHNVNLGATRDADLAHRIGVATALEVRASGAHYTFAPCVALVERGVGELGAPGLNNTHNKERLLWRKSVVLELYAVCQQDFLHGAEVGLYDPLSLFVWW